jgi:hypothetical protein
VLFRISGLARKRLLPVCLRRHDITSAVLTVSSYDPEMCLDEDPSMNPPECDDPNFSVDSVAPDMMEITNLYDESLVRFVCAHLRPPFHH